jgi:hypothetical protein
MPKDEPKVRRILHVRFTMPGGDPQQLLSMMHAARPFYQAFGGVAVKLLHNADDPAKFIQVIEYETPASLEQNRQQIASDARVQAYLQAVRTWVPGVVEMEVYRAVGGDDGKGET